MCGLTRDDVQRSEGDESTIGYAVNDHPPAVIHPKKTLPDTQEWSSHSIQRTRAFNTTRHARTEGWYGKEVARKVCKPSTHNSPRPTSLEAATSGQ